MTILRSLSARICPPLVGKSAFSAKSAPSSTGISMSIVTYPKQMHENIRNIRKYALNKHRVPKRNCKHLDIINALIKDT